MTTTLKYTLAQVRDREQDIVGTKGHPNAWWPLQWSPTSSDCLAFQTERLGLRQGQDVTNPYWRSIAAFRGHYGWPEPTKADLRPGDLALWNWDGGTAAQHIELIYSIDHAVGTITTISAATGPHPGIDEPIGVWKKTRLISPLLLEGIRPPYKPATAGVTSATRAKVRLIAGYLNTHRVPGAPKTSAETDGYEGPAYWTSIQMWGRAHDLYGPTFHIDGVPGPRSRAVEAAVYAKAKAAAR